MGKGDDPNGGAGGAATLTVASSSSALAAERIAADNPNISAARLASLPAEIDAVLSRPCLNGKQVLFLHVGGSMSYGLAHDESDLDVRGAYLADPLTLMGMDRPSDQLEDRAYDLVAYELRKFLWLTAIKAGPQQLECLYSSPLTCSPEGDLVLAHRDQFLSQQARATYAGFAMGNMRDLERNETTGTMSPAKRAKTIRHLFRLMEQGTHLLAAGEMQVKVTDPARYERWEQAPFERIAAHWQTLDEQLQTVPSVLPDQADMRMINDLLVQIRLQALDARRS